MKLFIDCNSEGLEDANRRLLIKTWFFYDFEKILCSLDRSNLSCFYDGFRDKECFFLISIEWEYLHELTSIEFSEEILDRFPLCSIEAHIEWSVKSERKSTFSIIIVSTTHTEIIEDEVDFWDMELTENCIQISKTLVDKRYSRSPENSRAEIFLRNIEVIIVTIYSDEYIIFTHMRDHHPSMSPKTERCIEDIFSRILSGKIGFYLMDEYRIMFKHREGKETRYTRENVCIF